MEAGIKGSWRNAALTGFLTVYEIVQRGVAVADPNVPAAINCCYVSSGKNRAKGVDVELSGSPLRGWEMGAGYTFNNNVRRSMGGRFDNFALSGQTPRHLFKLWTSHRLPGAWSRWTVGGSLQAQSTNYQYGAYICPQGSDSPGCPDVYQNFKMTQDS